MSTAWSRDFPEDRYVLIDSSSSADNTPPNELFCWLDEFQTEGACPSCGTQWGLSVPKAEEVEEVIEALPIESQPPSGSSKKRLRDGETSKASAVLSQPPPDVCGLRRMTRSSARLRWVEEIKRCCTLALNLYADRLLWNICICNHLD